LVGVLIVEVVELVRPGRPVRLEDVNLEPFGRTCREVEGGEMASTASDHQLTFRGVPVRC
jgi:hypothetical protein